MLSGFKIITGEVDVFSFVSKSSKHRHRCRNCGVQFASHNETKKTWSVWSATIDREREDRALPAQLAATAHMFYGTRVFDVADGLSKWEASDSHARTRNPSNDVDRVMKINPSESLEIFPSFVHHERLAIAPKGFLWERLSCHTRQGTRFFQCEPPAVAPSHRT